MSRRTRDGRGWPGLSLRARLVAGFAVAMTVVLLASGTFVYWRVAFALDRRLDSDLADSAATLRALLGSDGTLRDTSAFETTPALSDFQVLRPDNTVIAFGPGLGKTSLLTDGQLRAATKATTTVDVGSMVPISPRPLRLRADPVGAVVLVVGVRRDARDEALRELIVQLGLAGLGTLGITVLVGERLAKAALQPVERYRSQAHQIAQGTTGMRLDVPPDRDDEVTRLGQTLNSMLDALDQALSRERRFLQDASHELRTPLTLLHTRTQLALSRPRSTAEYQEILGELDTDVTALSRLADQLLQLGTAADTTAAGLSEPSATASPAAVLIALHQQTTVQPAAGLPPTWTLDLPADAPQVPMPAPKLQQIVSNLLANAALHGQPPVHAALRVANTDREPIVALTISDGGPGLSSEFLPRAVERFGRSDQSRSRPGVGLGLSLVLTLVDQHSGELRLCSDGHHHRYRQRFNISCAHPNRGTTATVLIPANPAPPPTADPPAAVAVDSQPPLSR